MKEDVMIRLELAKAYQRKDQTAAEIIGNLKVLENYITGHTETENPPADQTELEVLNPDQTDVPNETVMEEGESQTPPTSTNADNPFQ